MQSKSYYIILNILFHLFFTYLIFAFQYEIKHARKYSDKYNNFQAEINIKMFKCKLIHILDFLIENIFNTDARVKFRPKTNLQSFIRMRNFELPPLPPFVQHKVIIVYYKTRRLLGPVSFIFLFLQNLY